MLVLIILILEVSGTLTFCAHVKHLTRLTHSNGEDNKPPNKKPSAQYGTDATEKSKVLRERPGHRKLDKAAGTNEAAAGIVQLVERLASTRPCIPS